MAAPTGPDEWWASLKDIKDKQSEDISVRLGPECTCLEEPRRF
jgi:hypothetical protein